MLSILNIVAPVFALVALGYFAVRFRMFPATGVDGLIAFVNNFATPFLLFRAMLYVDFKTAFNPNIIGSFYTAALIVFIVMIILSRKVFANKPGQAVSAGFAAMFSNSVLLGLPIIQRAYDDDAMPIIFSIIGLHAPILFTVAMLTMEFSRRDGAPLLQSLSTALKRIVTSPILIGIGCGLLGNVLGIQLIEAADAFTRMMSQAVLPAALFGVGGALNAYRLRDNWRQAVTVSAGKLFLQPALTWLILVPILHVDINIARYAVVLSSMPAGINTYVFATTYNRSVDVAANTILITTASSVFSISFWLYLMS